MPLRAVPLLGGCVVSTLLVSACADAGGDPLATVVAPETHGAVLLGDGVPTLLRLIADHGLERDAAAESEAWQDSWEMDPAEGAALREQLYPLVSGLLFPLLGHSGTQDLLGRNALDIAAVESLTAVLASDAVSASLDRARRINGEARRLLAGGEGEGALALALAASDALWEVSPSQVARELLSRASEAFGRIRGDDSYSQEELIRIRRLVHGADAAMEAGDYPGTIRRAYYACQLLGVNHP